MWQDTIISAVGIIFFIALLPQVYEGFKKKRGLVTKTTSILTGSGLIISGYAFLTLGLFYSAIANFATGSLWIVLFMQRIIYKDIEHGIHSPRRRSQNKKRR